MLVSATISGLRCWISWARTATPMNSKEPAEIVLASSRSIAFMSTRAPERLSSVKAGSCTGRRRLPWAMLPAD